MADEVCLWRFALRVPLAARVLASGAAGIVQHAHGRSETWAVKLFQIDPRFPVRLLELHSQGNLSL